MDITSKQAAAAALEMRKAFVRYGLLKLEDLDNYGKTPIADAVAEGLACALMTLSGDTSHREADVVAHGAIRGANEGALSDVANAYGCVRSAIAVLQVAGLAGSHEPAIRSALEQLRAGSNALKWALGMSPGI